MMVRAARRDRDLDRAPTRGGAAARPRVAVHALSGLPRVARRHRRRPARARPRLGAATTRASPTSSSRSSCAPPYVVPETKDLGALLGEFRRTNQHMAIVVDEYGATMGIVTLEDVLEEIVGDIEDEFDLPDESVERVDERTIRIDGTFTIDDFNEEFGDRRSTTRTSTPSRGSSSVTSARGRGPATRSSTDELRFTVLETSGSRIQRLEVEFLPSSTPADEPTRDGVSGDRRPDGASTPRSATATSSFCSVRSRRARDRDVVRGDRVAGLRDQRRPARSRARRAGDVPPAAAPRAAGRSPRRPLPAAHAATRSARRARRASSLVGLLAVTRRGADADVAVLRARVRDRRRIGPRRARGPVRSSPSLVPAEIIPRALAQRSVVFQRPP